MEGKGWNKEGGDKGEEWRGEVMRRANEHGCVQYTFVRISWDKSETHDRIKRYRDTASLPSQSMKRLIVRALTLFKGFGVKINYRVYMGFE